jgi:glycosyltransferase involved in cell wall biosynthesis
MPAPTFGIAMVKDEADIVATTVTAMARQVDALIVLDNGSTDGTREILAELTDILELEVLDDPDPAYYQSAKMTRLACEAADRHAAWVVPFDADEIWYSPFAARIADMLDELAPQWLTAEAQLYNHVATGADADELDPVLRMGWRRRDPGPLPKVACRCRPDLIIDQGNHGAYYEGGTTRFENHLVVRHFPYRSVEQFERKVRNGARAYAATNLAEDVGAHWRQYGAILEHGGPEALAGVFREWFWYRDPSAHPELIYDPVAL